MNMLATPVQLFRNTRRGSVPGMSVDPLAEQEETTERFTVDLHREHAKFLERYAAYRNALNVAEGRKVKKWTRKSAAEALIATQIRQLTENMAAAFQQHGEFPDAADEKAMMAYARAVLASADKHSKKR